MSGRQATARRRPSSGARPARPSRTARRRRRLAQRRLLGFFAVVAVLALGIGAVMSPLLDRAVDEIAMPLRYEGIIREEAADKDLDPALIAAVIYVESRFRDQTSPAGAKGLMQIMPATADYIAGLSGGSEFEQGDLARPRINIAYGSYYLRYLLDRYGGNELLALAAYNGGEGKVDEWMEEARRRGERFRATDHIPFPETRDYVGRVFEARRAYRREYARQLGL